MSEVKLIIKKKDGTSEEVKGILKNPNREKNKNKEVRWKEKLEEIKHIIDEIKDDEFLNRPPPPSPSALNEVKTNKDKEKEKEEPKKETPKEDTTKESKGGIINTIKKYKFPILLAVVIGIYLAYRFKTRNNKSPTPKVYSPFSKTNTPKNYQ